MYPQLFDCLLRAEDTAMKSTDRCLDLRQLSGSDKAFPKRDSVIRLQQAPHVHKDKAETRAFYLFKKW